MSQPATKVATKPETKVATKFNMSGRGGVNLVAGLVAGLVNDCDLQLKL